jgi:hypothetical protein
LEFHGRRITWTLAADGSKRMRSVLTLGVLASGLLIALSVSADAATARRPHSRPPAVVRPSQNTAVPPGWYRFPGAPPIPPEQNRNLDPSNFGGG